MQPMAFGFNLEHLTLSEIENFNASDEDVCLRLNAKRLSKPLSVRAFSFSLTTARSRSVLTAFGRKALPGVAPAKPGHKRQADGVHGYAVDCGRQGKRGQALRRFDQ